MNKRSTLILTVIILLVSTMSLAAKSQKENTLDIGIVMPETNITRWVTDGEILKNTAIEMGYTAEVTYADGDQDEQNRHISDFISKGVDLIIVASINSGVNNVLSKASDAGIEVIAYDRLLLDSADFNFYITFNLKQVGRLQGESIVKALDLANTSDIKYITLFAGSQTDNNAHIYYDSAMEVLNPFIEIGNLVVIGPYAKKSADAEAFNNIATPGWRDAIAKVRMENLLNIEAKDVVLDAVLAPNDSIARAVIDACLTNGKYNVIEKLPMVTGQDGDLETIQYIKDKKQYMTIFKDTKELATTTIKLADLILRDRDILIDGIIQTKFDTNIKMVDTFLLSPTMVTAENYKEVFLETGYMTEDQLQ